MTSSWRSIRIVAPLVLVMATCAPIAESRPPFAVSHNSAGTNDNAEHPPFARAELHFIPWSVRTRAALSPSQVREHPYVSIRVENSWYLAAFVRWLRLDELQPSLPGDGPGDARLVIDLFDAAGARTSFYADRFRLLSEDGSKRRPIDSMFRNEICKGTLTLVLSGEHECEDR